MSHDEHALTCNVEVEREVQTVRGPERVLLRCGFSVPATTEGIYQMRDHLATEHGIDVAGMT